MYKLQSRKYGCPLFLNDDVSLILLPCFFSQSLISTKQIYGLVERSSKGMAVEQQIERRDVSDSTIYTILTRLEKFLYWVEKYSITSDTLNLNNHEAIPSELVNHYINEVLIEKERVSETGIFQHLMALNAYFNYLAVNRFSRPKQLHVKPKFRETARDNTRKRTAVKYLTPKLRSILYQKTSCMRDELLLRTGGEMGCRSMENQGFLLGDFKVGSKKHNGLKSLFVEMNSDKSKQVFEYYLQGKFSKSKRFSGGESRILYFHRSLLERFESYYKNERPKSAEQSFFLNDSANNVGTPITASRASRVFTEVRNKVIIDQKNGLSDPEGQMLEKDHTHHVLRHSFGTDKFYEYSQEKNTRIDDVTTTSQVYLAVAKLMGHSTNDQSAPQTTKRYIRSCHILQQFEEQLS